jgi:cytosine/creatinine deaminase
MVPSAAAYTLSNARLHFSLTPGFDAVFDEDGFALADLSIADGRIAAISRAAKSRVDVAGEGSDLGGRIVMPCFVDCHTHLDKGHIWPRRRNPDGSFMGALNAVAADRAANWTADDVRARMAFGLGCALAHGTKAIRTHLDSIAPQETISWPVFEELRADWKGRIVL